MDTYIMDDIRIMKYCEDEPELPNAVSVEDRQLAVMCHILGLCTSIFTPLIFYLSRKTDSDFLIHHETEAFNFQITMIVIGSASVGMDFFILQSVMLTPAAILINIVSCISASVKAKESVYYKYPISIPFFKHNSTKAREIPDSADLQAGTDE